MSPQDKVRSITADAILLAAEPEQIFGLFASPRPHWIDDLEIMFHALARVWHPDRAQDPVRSKSVMQALLELRGRAGQKIAAGTYGAVMSVTIKAKETYTDLAPLCAGDICDVYTASYVPDGKPAKRALVKLVRDPRDADLLRAEMSTLQHFFAQAGSDDAHFKKYLPRPLESAMVSVGSAARPANILSLTQDSHTLVEIMAAYPQGVHPADMAWMWRRVLEILSWVHSHKRVHGAILPCHILLNTEIHGGRIVDWCHSVESGSRIKAVVPAYEAFYPPEVQDRQPATSATDLYMTARCMKALLGEQVIPVRISRILDACLIERAGMRFSNPWEVYELLDKALRAEYGPPTFRTFTMPGKPAGDDPGIHPSQEDLS
jgi:hypothetical protein